MECRKVARRMAKRDRWHELCKLVEVDDGLEVRECGPWTEDKLWFWNGYITITTNAMVDKPQWREDLAYVDLFAGPGICRIKESGRRIPGSTLIAAHAPKPFRRIVACDLAEKTAGACEVRLKQSPAAEQSRVLRGDCNELIDQIIAEIPSGALTLAFVDPPGLDIDFETIRRLGSSRRVDFLVLFADGMDLIRNRERYDANPDSKLDRMLGPDSGWREQLGSLADHSGEELRPVFADIYKRQIARHLGYEGFREKVMDGPHGALYRLIYASRHERGLEFWDKITKRDRGGQSELFGP